MEKREESEVTLTTTSNRPLVRESAKRAREQMMKWSKILSVPPEDVEG